VYPRKSFDKRRNAPEPDMYDYNEKIKVPEMMVIGPDGPLGLMPLAKALETAQQMELDLVLVAPKSEPPVARVLNYKSFKYQKEKELRKNKASAKKTETKTIRLSSRIGQHDLDVRLRQAQKFIKNGDKVHIEIILRGRERQHGEVALEVVKDFTAQLEALIPIKIEQLPKRMGSRIDAIYAQAASQTA